MKRLEQALGVRRQTHSLIARGNPRQALMEQGLELQSACAGRVGGHGLGRVEDHDQVVDRVEGGLPFRGGGEESSLQPLPFRDVANHPVCADPVAGDSRQFLIPAENESALLGVSDEFVNHPRMGFRVAEVPQRCHVLLLLDH
ncbi:MAG: hypothetical protein NTW21_35740 [Verrucomicrobia bacterium]|nr:hypothetical protein [Verrucomicrobiota bacterium]